jgi:putative nucleotidyltransferase with HDIG domain
MSKIQDLEQAVRQLYATKVPERDEWADWLADHHVFVVADNATELAKRFGANEELSRAAALLHDIADAKMSRFAENHEETSLQMARELMQQAGFSANDIELVVEDAVRYHSCRDGHIPSSLEGKILATADAMAHFQTDFYVYFTWARGKSTPLHEVKALVLKKLEKDFNNKILFDEVKEECSKDYKWLKTLFSR